MIGLGFGLLWHLSIHVKNYSDTENYLHRLANWAQMTGGLVTSNIRPIPQLPNASNFITSDLSAQNDHHFANNLSKAIIFYKNCYVWSPFSLFSKGSIINNNSPLIYIFQWDNFNFVVFAVNEF